MRRFALLVLAWGGAASAEAPSGAAVALAHAMNAASPAKIDQIAHNIARGLLTSQAAWRGLPCDAAVAACRDAAEALGREAAPALVAKQQALSDRLLAVVIDGSMAQADIVKATQFVGTPTGKALFGAIERMRSPAEMPVELRKRLEAEMATLVVPYDAKSLTDRFYDQTASLPRGKLPFAPPPPPAPSIRP